MRRLALLCLLVLAVFAEIRIVSSLSEFDEIRSAQFYGDFVYVLSGNHMSVVRPHRESPEIVGMVDLEHEAMAAAFHSSFAFVVHGDMLSIFDLREPREPRLAAVHHTRSIGQDIKIAGEYLFVASLVSVDIFFFTSRTDVVFLTSIPSRSERCVSVEYWNSLVLMGESEAGIYIYDITSEPARLRGMVEMRGEVLDIEIQDNFAFVADGSASGTGMMTIVDLRAEAVIGNYFSERGSCLNGTIVCEQYYLLADGYSLKILDISRAADGAVLVEEFREADGRITYADYNDDLIVISAGHELIFAESDELCREIDASPPVASLLQPLTGVFTSNPMQAVQFEITDYSGVDPATIILDVNGSEYTVDDGELTFESDTLTFTPAEGWEEGRSNTVRLTSYGDILGNISSLVVMTRFTGDYTPPHLLWSSPEDGEIDRSSTTAIQIAIGDNAAGVNIDSVEMTINDEPVTPTFTPFPGDTGYIITYHPTSPYPSSMVTACVNNLMDRVTFGEPNTVGICITFYTDGIKEAIPQDLSIMKLSPNPFNSALSIRFAGNGRTTIDAFDVNGNHIAGIYDGDIYGLANITWNPDLQSGVYIIRLATEDAVSYSKALLIK